MLKYMAFFVGMLFTACTTGQNEPRHEPASQAATVEKQTPVTPASQPAPGQNRLYHSSSRPADQIRQDYPYDIELKKADGTTVRSDEVFPTDGKPTVLMFWLTTCGPCRMELNAINKKFHAWEQEADFNFYAISTDFPKNYESFVKRVEESNWPWEAYNDVNREFMQVMPGRLNGLPQIFLLDANGQIAYHTRKYRPGDEDKLFAEIRKLAARG